MSVDLEKGESSRQSSNDSSTTVDKDGEFQYDKWAGPFGAAHLIATDPNQGAFPTHNEAAAVLLLALTITIWNCMAKLKRLEQKRAKERWNSTQSKVPLFSKQQIKLLRKLERYYGRYARLVREAAAFQTYAAPEKRGIKGLKTASQHTFNDYHRLLSEVDRDDLCNPFDQGDKIEKLLQRLPGSGRAGEWFCYPFLTKEEGPIYNWKAMRFTAMVAQFLILGLFFAVVYPLKAYNVVSHTVIVSLILVSYMLFALYASWLDPQGRIPILAVLAYGAIFAQDTFTG